jgi:hypothetical protein
MTHPTTAEKPTATAPSRAKKRNVRFTAHKISETTGEEKPKPFFPKDVRPGTLIVVE